MKYITSFAIVFVLVLSLSLKAQLIFFNNGATIWSGPSSIIQVNGGIENNSSTSNGRVEHHGTMTVDNSTTPGDVRLNNSSVWLGNGEIRVEGDWVNNAVFIHQLSEVKLDANNNPQLITGTVADTFHILRCQGNGTGLNRVKTQTLNVWIDSLLDLTNRELATGINTNFVLNPDPTVVTNITSTMGQEGFVSSLAPGVLSRATNQATGYLFPTGSSIVLTRYRPVVLNPQNNSVNDYTVRFINHDADNDGFIRSSNDGIPCLTIDTFYHAILRPLGTTAADITIGYDPPADGTWDGMAHWRTTNTMWNDMASSTLVNPGTLGNYSTLTRLNWLFANPGEPYLLTEIKPAAPQIVCPGIVCANTPNGGFTVNGTGTAYTWTVGNGTISTGQGTDSITVIWTGTSGWVYVVENSPSGCPSLPDSCFVNVSTPPIADFDTIGIGYYNPLYSFLDSSTGAITWFWDFGDGSTSLLQNPNHQYNGAGTYIVTLIVTNANGCVDTIQTTIIVPEGILIPNVFTPDGDGINDEWYIPNSGMESFRVQIFNRWGTKIFEAESDEIRWDGRSTAGVMMSDGTYYYILDAVLKTQSGNVPVVDFATGYITLITAKKK